MLCSPWYLNTLSIQILYSTGANARTFWRNSCRDYQLIISFISKVVKGVVVIQPDEYLLLAHIAVVRWGRGTIAFPQTSALPSPKYFGYRLRPTVTQHQHIGEKERCVAFKYIRQNAFPAGGAHDAPQPPSRLGRIEHPSPFLTPLSAFCPRFSRLRRWPLGASVWEEVLPPPQNIFFQNRAWRYQST